MKLPNLSYMIKVGQLRYIQAIYERAEYRNPDTLVRDFLTTFQRWACDLRGTLQLGKLRSQSFYYYVLARTKHYDAVFVDAISEGVRYIVNIGCGSDTRAYRFGHALKERGVRVLECDQAEAIHSKQRIARRRWPIDHVEYLSIDLNDASWPDFENWLRRYRNGKVLVLMEGVSPYVNKDSFIRFLGLLATALPRGSRVAYDFKVIGVADGFGQSSQTRDPFRISGRHNEIVAYHEAFGYQLEHLELSADLSRRLLPDLEGSGAPLFQEDCLVRLLLPDAPRSSGALPSHAR